MMTGRTARIGAAAIIAAALVAGLAGCGGNEGGAGAPAPVAASGWDATQACAMLDVGKLSALTGKAFESAKLTPMASMTENTRRLRCAITAARAGRWRCC